MNIAVLGASFDPSHNGHLKIANNVLKSQKADKVILMPVNIHPFAKKLTKAYHRLKMAKMLEGKNIEVSDLEIKRGKISYTIDTLNQLKKLYPKDLFVWIIGEDQIKNFTKWKDWQKIIKDFGLIVVPRDISHENQKNIIILNVKDFPPLDISSSEIKKRIKEGKSIKNLVPKVVENYIIRNKLYE